MSKQAPSMEQVLDTVGSCSTCCRGRLGSGIKMKLQTDSIVRELLPVET